MGSVVVGCLIGLVAILVFISYMVFRRKRQRAARSAEAPQTDSAPDSPLKSDGPEMDQTDQPTLALQPPSLVSVYDYTVT